MRHFTSRSSSLLWHTLAFAFGMLAKGLACEYISGQRWRCDHNSSSDGSSTATNLSKSRARGCQVSTSSLGSARPHDQHRRPGSINDLVASRSALVPQGTGRMGCLPWLLYISRKMKDRTIRTAYLKLLWVMLDAASLQWVSQELEVISHLATRRVVKMEYFKRTTIHADKKEP